MRGDTPHPRAPAHPAVGEGWHQETCQIKNRPKSGVLVFSSCGLWEDVEDADKEEGSEVCVCTGRGWQL